MEGKTSSPGAHCSYSLLSLLLFSLLLSLLSTRTGPGLVTANTPDWPVEAGICDDDGHPLTWGRVALAHTWLVSHASCGSQAGGYSSDDEEGAPVGCPCTWHPVAKASKQVSTPAQRLRPASGHLRQVGDKNKFRRTYSFAVHKIFASPDTGDTTFSGRKVFKDTIQGGVQKHRDRS